MVTARAAEGCGCGPHPQSTAFRRVVPRSRSNRDVIAVSRGTDWRCGRKPRERKRSPIKRGGGQLANPKDITGYQLMAVAVLIATRMMGGPFPSLSRARRLHRRLRAISDPGCFTQQLDCGTRIALVALRIPNRAAVRTRLVGRMRWAWGLNPRKTQNSQPPHAPF
jgi:hypothetical protein